MRVPSFERFQRFSAYCACLVCGMVVGAAVFNGLFHAALSSAVERNYKLSQQVDLYKEEIRRLNENSRQESVIRSLVVFIEEPQGKPAVDVVAEKELKKRLKTDLAVLQGKRVYEIAEYAAIARKLLEKKVYAGIGANDYMVERIKTMLVADGVLQVWVEVAQAALRP